MKTRNKPKTDTSLFTDEKGGIQTKKLSQYIIDTFNIVHIKPSRTSTASDAIIAPLYCYNAKAGVYEELTAKCNAGLDAIIYKATGNIEITSGKLNDTIRHIKATAPIKPFIDTNIIAFDNALYDVTNNTVLTKSPDIVTTTRMRGVTYDPTQVEHSALDEFMNTLFYSDKYNDNDDMMRFIYECIGYCLVNNTFAQKFFILYGTGGNGKSTFLNLLKMLLTDKNISAISLIDINSNKFRLADIMGKFANIGDDIESTAVLNTAQ